jgi:hypothetical protein
MRRAAPRRVRRVPQHFGSTPYGFAASRLATGLHFRRLRMRVSLIVGIAVLLPFASLACGSATSPAVAPVEAHPPATNVVVADAPQTVTPIEVGTERPPQTTGITGTIGGKPFVARSALVVRLDLPMSQCSSTTSPRGAPCYQGAPWALEVQTTWLHVYEHVATCDEVRPQFGRVGLMCHSTREGTTSARKRRSTALRTSHRFRRGTWSTSAGGEWRAR